MEQMDNWGRYLWGLNMLAFLVASLYFTWMMLKEYIENRTATHIIPIQNNTMTLPTFYVCPKNPDTFNYDILFADISRRTGITAYNDTRDILLYYIAGSGFQNTKVDKWKDEQLQQVSLNYNRWRGGRSLTDLFQFTFNDNGLSCQDVFINCTYRERPLNCCEIFKPSYVLMRGKCLRLSRFNQLGAGEGDKLILSFATPASRLIDGGPQKQFVIYLGDDYPEIAMYPRLYLTYGYVGKIRLKARQLFMKHKQGHCNFNQDDKGKYTCFVNHWLVENIVGPFNCTFAYLTKTRVSKGLPTCDPDLVVQHYDELLNAGVIKYRCLLNCERWDYFFKYTTNVNRERKDIYNIEIYFPDIFYEIYSEIQITSWTAFISQVGGQIVLFLGTSIVSLIYIATSITKRGSYYYSKWFWRRRLSVSGRN